VGETVCTRLGGRGRDLPAAGATLRWPLPGRRGRVRLLDVGNCPRLPGLRVRSRYFVSLSKHRPAGTLYRTVVATALRRAGCGTQDWPLDLFPFPERPRPSLLD